MPPVSSRTMVKSVPLQTSALSGEASTKVSEAKKHGRRLPKVPISLRSLRMPCSGRTAPVPHLGPPMAPRSTASAFFAAVRASSVRGEPVASIDAWESLVAALVKGLMRTYTAEKVFLEVELHIGVLFYYFEQLEQWHQQHSTDHGTNRLP